MESKKNGTLNEKAGRFSNTKFFYSNHILRALLILFFSFSNLNGGLAANESVGVNKEGAPVAISIGGFCHLALGLKHHGIRKEAYPFDWVITPSQSLIKVITEDFYNFFSLQHMQGFTNTYTGMAFVHDFPSLKDIYYPDEMPHEESRSVPGNENEYVWNYKKYMRRIERFKKVLSSNKKVILLRSPATKKEALIIRDLFISKYPSLNFTLVVVNHDPVIHEGPWNEERILNYYVPHDQFFKLEYNGPEWMQVFVDSKLINPTP